jgi:hypothetical protein
MNKDEALRLALEALEDIGDEWGFTSQRTVPKRKEAIACLRLVIDAENISSKPMAWEQFYPEMGKPKLVEVQDGECKHCTDGCPACDARKLPEQKPFAWYDPTNCAVSTDKDSPLFTPLGQVWPLYPQSEQEPVAWFSTLPDGKLSIKIVGKPTEGNWEPLYTTPPQRTWVGMTDEEKNSFWKADQMTQKEWDELFSDIEAKLKEKNVQR